MAQPFAAPEPAMQHLPPAAADAEEDIGEPALKRARSSADESSQDATANIDNKNNASPQNGANGSANANGQGTSNARLYSCGKCSKSYARLDHL